MRDLMPHYESLSIRGQAIARAMADAAKEVMIQIGMWPLNNDHAAIFDEACATYLIESLKVEKRLHDVAAQIKKEMGFE
jgi:hypothetical protein